MKKMTILLLLSFIIITSSCATIFTESKRKVTFVTYPESANIFVNGQYIGQTPIQLKVKPFYCFSSHFITRAQVTVSGIDHE